MSESSTNKGFGCIELVVVLIIIVTLCSIALPGGSFLQAKSAETKALSNAKSIGLACKLYAIDHDGHFPTVTVVSSSTSYSNTAFDLLFPTYLETIQIFYQPKSAWTPVLLNDPTPEAMTAGKPSLPAGSNEWAYVGGLTDKSNPAFPLITDGFANIDTHTYTTDATAKGGVWKGREAIVLHCDDSASVTQCNPSTHVVPGSPNGIDLFDTSGQPGWLSSTGTNAQHVLNPE